MRARDITQVGLFLALLIICSQISVPIGPVPVTLQTFAVLAIGLLVKPKVAFLTTGLYALIGLIGIPVFANWSGGLQSIMSPTFGFVLSFILVSTLLAYYNDKKGPLSIPQKAVALVIATILIYIIGVAYFYFQQKLTAQSPMNLSAIISVAVTPFLLGDFVKGVAALILADRLEKVLAKRATSY